MLTIDEIARLAGVSPATVSKVLNNRPYVSSETRARVERVIAETGFVPSQWARLRSERRSHILGLVIPSTSDQLFADPQLLEIMRGIEAAEAATRLLRGGVIDGAVVVETLDLRPFAEILGAEPASWVVIGYPPAWVVPPVPAVHADDYGGARAAVRHLIAQGHRRIGVISSAPRPHALDERLRAIDDALVEVDLGLNEALVAVGDGSPESGEACGHALLARPHPPTAIFALNDRMAIGVARAAVARGLSVPADLSVVGFDDIAPATLLTPPLTTVRQPGYRLGEAAVDTLLRLLAGGLAEPPAVIPAELIVRGTVAPPQAPERG